MTDTFDINKRGRMDGKNAFISFPRTAFYISGANSLSRERMNRVGKGVA